MNNKNILIGTPVKNGAKFLDNFLNKLNNLSYPKENISLCFIENDSEDDTWSILNEIISKKIPIHEYKDITILKLDLGFLLKHECRYQIEHYQQRINNLVILRNFIVNNYLKNNDYLWWLDIDVENFQENSIEYLLSLNKDIVMPLYTHNTYGYHDCASYTNLNGKVTRLYELTHIFPNEEIIELERCECAAFINRKVFDSGLRYLFVDDEYTDLCGNVIPCKLEGVSFSENAKKLGFNIYGCSWYLFTTSYWM